MTDLQSAVSLAVYSALNGSTQVTALADVWQNPPEDTQPITTGLVLVGLVALATPETKDGGLEKATIPVFTYVRQPDARKLYALNTAVRAALEGQRLASDTAVLGRPEFLDADPELMEDGETYFDKLRFELFVQPA